MEFEHIDKAAKIFLILSLAIFWLMRARTQRLVNQRLEEKRHLLHLEAKERERLELELLENSERPNANRLDDQTTESFPDGGPVIRVRDSDRI